MRPPLRKAICFIALILLISSVSAITWSAAGTCQTATNGSYTLYRWTTTGFDTFTIPPYITSIDYFVQSAGGAGADYSGGGGGGGGAGGQLNGTLSVTPGQVVGVTVGSGGTTATTNGGNSTFWTIEPFGGGRGGRNGGPTAVVGGSGGGGATASSGALGTLLQGLRGGNGNAGGGGGGGGGFGAIGQSNASAATGGWGGDGGYTSITGEADPYGGGGGGGSDGGGSATNTGGLGGGGKGGTIWFVSSACTAGTANTGGGGGAGGNPAAGCNGGSGIVIIRFLTATPVVASFVGAPTYGTTPLTVYFNSSNTTGGSGISTYAYNWTFGDGGTSTLANPSYSYVATGNYTVNLTVNSGGINSTYSILHYIIAGYSAIPTADFSANVTSGNQHLPVLFTDLTTGSPTVWNWSFGEGNYSSSQNPTFVYDVAGTYTVNLTATNPLGNTTISKSDYITIYPAGTPKADFTANPTSGSPSLLVTFLDLSTGTSPLNWTWSFGDNTYSTTQNPTHVYNASGVYTVSLYVNNSIGNNTLTKTSYISVSNSQNNVWYTPWQVRMRILDYNSNPLPGTTIQANYMASSLPSTQTSWLISAFGITSQVAADMLNSSVAMTGVTDNNGGVDFTMFKSLEYQLTITNTTSGVAATKRIYPADQEYDIRVALPSQTTTNNTLTAMQYTSLPIYQIDGSTYNLSVIYRDTAGLTTNVAFQVLYRNGTYLLNQDLGNPGTNTVIGNYTVSSPAIGSELIWRYNATRSES